jgi:rod shape-determining protein MreC
MDFLLTRFRNLALLVAIIGGQLLLLAYQVKTGHEIRLIRVWAVTAITPLARVVEFVRSGTTGFFSDYFYLLDVRDDNRRLKSEVGRLKLENQFLKTELSTADRARALAAFQSRSPSQTIPARIIGNGTGANSKVVFIDRGSNNGIQKGMAVITPDGIVGKVVESFPMASQVLLITDPTFAAGVVSQKNHIRGTLKGQGKPVCYVDYVQNEEKIEAGEWFFTSGDDRVFPRGLPVGQVTAVRPGRSGKEIYVTPSAFQSGFEEVLVVLEGVHQAIPEPGSGSAEVHMLPPPPGEGAPASAPGRAQQVLSTDADRLLERYRKIGEVQAHVYGEGTPGSRPPNFNINPDEVKRGAAPPPAAAKVAGQSSNPPAASVSPTPQPGGIGAANSGAAPAAPRGASSPPGAPRE